MLLLTTFKKIEVHILDIDKIVNVYEDKLVDFIDNLVSQQLSYSYKQKITDFELKAIFPSKYNNEEISNKELDQYILFAKISRFNFENNTEFRTIEEINQFKKL